MATKTDNGQEFPAEAYAYVPDPAEPSTWKIRLWHTPEDKVTKAQLGAAAAALSPGGFRGEKADIPESAIGGVKARIRGAYKSLGVKTEDMPESVRLSESLFVINLGLLTLSDDETKPVRIPIAMVGTFYKGKQKFSITKADVATMAANFRKRGNGEVVMDYEHASEFPDVAAGGPIPAAGWIVGIDPDPDDNGVVWGSAKFTARARDMIAAGEYKYGSPALSWGARDKSTGDGQGLTLTSFALTNTPVLDRMPAIRLSDAAKKGENEPVAKQEVMCSEHPRTKMLCPKCDADEIANLNASEHTHSGPKVIQLSEVKRDGKGRLDLSSLGNEAVISLAVYRAVDAERVALSEVEAAVKEGRIAPANRESFEKLALSDIENFRTIVKTMKPQVDRTERGHGGGGEGLSVAAELQQIDVKLSERADVIARDQKIPFGDAMKLAAREDPAVLRRRAILTRKAHASAVDEEVTE